MEMARASRMHISRNSDRFPGSRNNDRLPWNTTFDLGFNTKLRLQEIINLKYVRTFYVLNAENLSGYSNNATQSNQFKAVQMLVTQRNASQQFNLVFVTYFKYNYGILSNYL
jgi:hypothetical protein